MTPDDGAAFDDALAALAAVTGKTLDIIVKRAYWVALEDIPGLTVLAALTLAMRSDFDFFPTSGQLRRLCDEVEATDERFALQAQAAVPALPAGEIIETYQDEVEGTTGRQAWCGTCQDSGFEHFICEPGNRCMWSELCRKLILLHGDDNVPPHSFVRKCHCLAQNPVIIRRIERMRETINIGKYSRPRPRSGRQRRPPSNLRSFDGGD
jgi:hypothetical protein